MVDEKVRIIRDYINHPWKLGTLVRDKVKWNMLCSSMDAIQDTQLAVESFVHLDDFTANDGGYLYLYGLLQALFLQQDALNHLSKALFDTEINYREQYPDVYDIRELRNDAIGHPTNRGNKSFHFIPRISITNKSFAVASYFPRDVDYFKHKEIKIKSLLEQQERDALDILTKTIIILNQEIEEHKLKFKDSKLIPLTNGINYDIGKIFESIYGDYPIVKINLNNIKDVIESIKSGLDERYGSYKELASSELLIDDIQYVFNKLENWLNTNQLSGNQDAKIFCYALRCKFDELIEILQEIDKEFSD